MRGSIVSVTVEYTWHKFRDVEATMHTPTKIRLGQVVGGRYQIIGKLGEGGMGAVYRAVDRNLDKDVVVKVPRAIVLEDPGFVDRWKREIKALIRLEHPNIVRIFDQGLEDGLPFAVMQFLVNGSLEARRTKRESEYLPMCPESLTHWLMSVARALDYIHEQGYVHRDIKPDNILFDQHDTPYAGDFGVVKVFAESKASVKLTGSGMVLGTPEYMAPEVIMGESFDGRADQYALAASVHEVLAGAPPFTGATPAAVIVKQTQAKAPELAKHWPAIDPGLSDAVRRALSKDPTSRFRTCIEFAESVLAHANTVIGATVKGKAGRVPCPSCRIVLPTSQKHADKSGRCPNCTVKVRISPDLCQLVLSKPRNSIFPPPTTSPRTSSGSVVMETQTDLRAEYQVQRDTRVELDPPFAATEPATSSPKRRARTRNPLSTFAVTGIAATILLCTLIVTEFVRRTSSVEPQVLVSNKSVELPASSPTAKKLSDTNAQSLSKSIGSEGSESSKTPGPTPGLADVPGVLQQVNTWSLIAVEAHLQKHPAHEQNILKQLVTVGDDTQLTWAVERLNRTEFDPKPWVEIAGRLPKPKTTKLLMQLLVLEPASPSIELIALALADSKIDFDSAEIVDLPIDEAYLADSRISNSLLERAWNAGTQDAKTWVVRQIIPQNTLDAVAAIEEERPERIARTNELRKVLSGRIAGQLRLDTSKRKLLESVRKDEESLRQAKGLVESVIKALESVAAPPVAGDLLSTTQARLKTHLAEIQAADGLRSVALHIPVQEDRVEITPEWAGQIENCCAELEGAKQAIADTFQEFDQSVRPLFGLVEPETEAGDRFACFRCKDTGSELCNCNPLRQRRCPACGGTGKLRIESTRDLRTPNATGAVKTKSYDRCNVCGGGKKITCTYCNEDRLRICTREKCAASKAKSR